jgi:CelD/BcsL family acetyltransferase involved in cellulose biosynthesis
LSIDGQTIAVKLGMEFGDTFWAMVSSLRADGLERMSPGDIALRQTIQACCNAGLTSIDLAQGESNYKTQWADGAIQLHTIMAPLNIRGTLWAQAMSLSLTCKRTIKTSDTLWPLAQRLRAQLLGRKLA